ncbi:DsbA family protein [Haliangium sp.]|uniref:DsbA family protein n=1 Tax=Haliangium sp. TaxID=2663208 RepID=UPI003D095AB5
MTSTAASKVQKYVFPAFLAMAALALTGASCDKATVSPVEAEQVVTAIDKAEGKTPAAADQDQAGAAKAVPAAAPAEPVSGVDVGALDEAKKQRFYALSDTLQSPCGKAHSLRTSLAEDQACKRGPFAARYVLELLADEATDAEVKEVYEAKYKPADTNKTFQLDGVPYSGAPDAPVKVVEFYDYGCPSCKQFAPVLAEAMSAFPSDAVLFYKQFPLPGHQYSKGAAQAALAAAKQDKFAEMHAILFAKAPYHRKPELLGYAKSLGLDLARFEADMEAVLPRVEAEIVEGDAAGVNGTPTTFINGRTYEGPMHPKYIRLWIEEELAVNR